MTTNPDQPADAAELRRRAEDRLRLTGGGQTTAVETIRLVHELQVHQIELEIQNEELQQAHAHAETLLAQYTDLYDCAPAGYMTLDREGAIRQVNVTGARLFGVERARLVNRRLGLFVAEGDRRTFNDFLQNVFVNPTKACCEVTLPQEDSHPLVLQLEGTRSADGQECRAVMLDITARKRAEKEIRDLNAGMELRVSILDATPDFVGYADAKDTHILYINPAGRKMIGLGGEKDVTRLKIADVHPEWVNKLFRDESMPTAIRDGVWTGECAFLNQDGREIPAMMVMLAHKSPSGEVERFSTISRDITEQQRAQAAVAEALRAKSEFMNNVTHELRTPLNAVIGFAELLKDEVPGPLNPKQAAFAADILASGERLLALVEGILEMSRLDVATAALEREPVEIGAVIDERVAAHRKAAEARGVTLRLDVAPDAGSVELAPKALRRMLDALIDNAIKFNRDGGTVAVSARRAGDALEIAVADTGVGIAREDLPKLFKPMVQFDAGLARKQGGIGMGLALARRLAEMHGGTIEVASEPGKGSTFTLRLPIEEHS